MRPPLACIALVLAALLPCAAQSQRPSSAALDSTSRRCLAVSWLSASATCEGRVLNAAGLSLAGAGAGALAGYVGGTVSPSRCLGHAEKSAVRGVNRPGFAGDSNPCEVGVWADQRSFPPK
ncbi:MAG: hypothetical protein AMXMBFR55_28400 [Gemmatimonadota bacterium]